MENAKNIGNPGKKVVGVMKSGEIRTLAELIENGWSVLENLWFFHLPHKCTNDGHLFELTGAKTVCIYSEVFHFKICCPAKSSLGS